MKKLARTRDISIVNPPSFIPRDVKKRRGKRIGQFQLTICSAVKEMNDNLLPVIKTGALIHIKVLVTY
jgi:hypothetical protein